MDRPWLWLATLTCFRATLSFFAVGQNFLEESRRKDKNDPNVRKGKAGTSMVKKGEASTDGLWRVPVRKR